MSGFTVGDQTVGSPLITPEIEKQFQEEEKLITEVTEETFEPIERTNEQNAAIEQVKNASY